MSPLLNPQKARPPTQKTAGPHFLVREHGWAPAFVAPNGCRRRMLWRRLGRRLAPAGKQFLVRIGPPHKNATKGRTPKPGVRHPCRATKVGTRLLDAGVTGCKNCCNFLGKNKNCKKRSAIAKNEVENLCSRAPPGRARLR
jgi:hypothetical protein